MDITEYRILYNKLHAKNLSSKEQIKKFLKLNKEQKEILDDYIELEKYWADKSAYDRGQLDLRNSIKNILDIKDEYDY
jgi:hypothetical protein